jgi:3D (Asp-Asp-Asp) domain-containing protein
MIGLIIKTLNSIAIVSVKNIVDLKHCLMSNYPDLDSNSMQQYVVEFISNTLDSCLSYFSAEYRQPLRQIVLNNARKLNFFEVYASDILKAGLQLANDCPAFKREIANWVGGFPVDNLAKEAVVNYILNHCQYKTKPGNQQLKSKRPLSGNSQPRPAVAFQSDPYASTVAIKLDGEKFQPVKTEEIKWFNPYVDQNGNNEARHFAAEDEEGPTVVFMGPLGFLRKFPKSLWQKMRRLFKKSNVYIATVVFFLVLIGFPRVINFKAVKVIGMRKVAVAPDVGSNDAFTRTSDIDVGSGLNHASDQKNAQGTVDTVKRLIRPILDAPNTIIIGYIKEKTAAGIVEVPVRRYFERKMRLKATAYDLSLASCGKDFSHPEYGITRTGTRARRGRTVAVDPRVIPLGRKVYIMFPKKYSHMNGIYVAEDTGSKIKGYRIDVFWGEDAKGERKISREARTFGCRKVEIYLLED